MPMPTSPMPTLTLPTSPMPTFPKPSFAAPPALRRFAAAVLVGLAAVLAASQAFAETTRVTFLLVNDVYQMGDEAMADGKRRGGFARLAAIVKAERAKG